MTLKKTLLASAAGAALFVLSAPAATVVEAGSIKNGSATDLTIYGRVSRQFMVYNDGEEAGYLNTDGFVGDTRFGFKAKGKINEAVSVEGRLELDFKSNDPTSDINQSNEVEGDKYDIRHSWVSFNHKAFGKMTLGQQSTVSQGMSDGLDLGFAALAFSGMDPSLRSGGILFRNDDATGNLSSTSVRNVFTTMDRGRSEALKYETPNMNGFSGLASLYDSGNWGIGARYDGKHGSFKVRGRAFYENLSSEDGTGASGDTGDRWQVGASVKHDSGISLTGLYGQRDRDDRSDNGVSYGVTLGYTANLNALGATGIGIHYEGTEDIAAAGIDGQAVGLGISQQIKNAGTDIYSQLMWWDADVASSATPLESVVTFLVGARVKF